MTPPWIPFVFFAGLLVLILGLLGLRLFADDQTGDE